MVLPKLSLKQTAYKEFKKKEEVIFKSIFSIFKVFFLTRKSLLFYHPNNISCQTKCLNLLLSDRKNYLIFSIRKLQFLTFFLIGEYFLFFSIAITLVMINKNTRISHGR